MYNADGITENALDVGDEVGAEVGAGEGVDDVVECLRVSVTALLRLRYGLQLAQTRRHLG